MEENVVVNENVPKRKGRKKLLYQKIINQMEFYFSAANLSKDRFLNQKLQQEGAVCITEFLRFNKIRSLTQDVNDVVNAVKKSKLLTITEDMKVKPIEPVKYKENEDDCIIYVEQVPRDADHDWLTNHFSKYGKVDYVSIPKFKKSGKCKGFAFIEFAEVDFAQKAIEDYKKNGNYLPAATEPSELISIATFEDPNDNEKQTDQSKSLEKKSSETTVSSEMELEPITDESIKTESNGNNKSAKKRRNVDTFEAPMEKKIKLGNSDEERTGINEDDASKQEEDDGDTTEKDGENEAVTVEGSTAKKVKKKKSKKNKVDVYSGLQILSKKDWKRLRNKYLNLQKERMSKLKKVLYLQRQNGLSKKNDKIIQKHENKEEEKEENKPSKLSFSPGLIVKIKCEEPVIDIKAFKKDLKKNPSLEFVDVKEGETTVYLRFSSPDAASEFCKDSTWSKTKILKGDKESEYWNKIESERAEKFAKPQKRKKERGKDKLMKKAVKMLGTHIKFD